MKLFAVWLLTTGRMLVAQAQAGREIERTVEPVFGYHKGGEETTSGPDRVPVILSGEKREIIPKNSHVRCPH
jgi:hypothetical protein